MLFSVGMATADDSVHSIDVFVAFGHTAGVVQSDSRRHQGDGDGVHTDVNPPLVGKSEVEVERQAEQEAPSSHGSLATGNRCVVEGRPGVVDDQTTEPISNGLALIDDLGPQSDETGASGDEDGVSENLVVETVFGITKGCVGRFEGKKAAPGDVIIGVNHANHVQHGQQQAPEAYAHHYGRVHGSLFRVVPGVRIVAHGPCDLRTAFKHTEPAVHRTNPPAHREVWWW